MNPRPKGSFKCLRNQVIKSWHMLAPCLLQAKLATMQMRFGEGLISNRHGQSNLCSCDPLRQAVVFARHSPPASVPSSIPYNCNCYTRRKFRSQTADSMDRWKAGTGRVREEKRKDEKRKEEERRSKKRKSQKKEDPGARKGRKVGSLKRRVRSHTSVGPLLEVEMSKKRAPL